MKLKLDTVLLNRDGSEFKQRMNIPYYEEKDGEVIEKQRSEMNTVTLGRMLSAALLTKAESIDEAEIMEKYNLFLKVDDKEEVELDKKEIELLKKLVCQRYEIFFVGQIINLLTK